MEYLQNVTNNKTCDVDDVDDVNNNVGDRLSDSGIGDEEKGVLDTFEKDYGEARQIVLDLTDGLLTSGPGRLESPTGHNNELDMRGNKADLVIEVNKNENESLAQSEESLIEKISDEHKIDTSEQKDDDPEKDAILPTEEENGVTRVGDKILEGSENESKTADKSEKSSNETKGDAHKICNEERQDEDPNKDAISPKEEETGVKRVTWSEAPDEKYEARPSRSQAQHERSLVSRGRNLRQGMKEIGRQRSMDSTKAPQQMATTATTTSRSRSAAPVLRAWERSLRRNSPARRKLETGVAGDDEREESGGMEEGGPNEGSGKEVDWEEDGEGVRKPVRRMRSKRQRPSSGRPLWNNANSGTSFNRYSYSFVDQKRATQ